MKSGDPLLIAWAETLARKGDAPAIFNSPGTVSRTFCDIEQQARSLERKIEIFDPESVVGIQIGNHPDWPALFIACLRRKLIVLPLEQSMSDDQRDRALGICFASGILSQPVATETSNSVDILSATRIDSSSSQRIGRRDSKQPSQVSSGTRTQHVGNTRSSAAIDWGNYPPVLLKLTSGTTALPRAIRFRSEQLLADCDQICRTMGIRDLDLCFGIIPISHSYGFSNLLTPLITRGVPMVLSCDRVPRAVLLDLERTNATVFPGTPVLYQAFCEMKDVPTLPELRLCISAGAPLSATVATRFFEHFKRPIHSFYGSSECGGICYDCDGEVFADGFVGTPLKDVDLTLVDPKAGSSQIQVRSAAVGDGYFPEPDLDKLSRGIFTPDDLLARCGNGLKIVGRISDVINVAGKKINPALVEEQLLRFSGVRDAIAFGRKSSQRNEEVAACVVTDRNVSAADLIDFCRARLTAWQVPRQIFIVDEIPVTERGKISRRELSRRFSAEA
jgi:long-chain acyl-CoA synthetase